MVENLLRPHGRPRWRQQGADLKRLTELIELRRVIHELLEMKVPSDLTDALKRNFLRGVERLAMDSPYGDPLR